MPRGLGTIQQKVLLLLFGGAALSLSGSPRRFFRVLNAIEKEWRAINRQSLERAIRGLYRSQLISERHGRDGAITLVLSHAGKQRALTYRAGEMTIEKPHRWDGMWRVILFDIPERQKKSREAFRMHLKQLGLREFQKSVFIHPHPCSDEIEFLIELHRLRPFVRQLVAKTVDNELHVKKWFSLL